jgi:hypothetical protein
MSLTTEEVIGGMYRAHRAGQPFAALMANPLFANLPLAEKQKVLGGLRQRVEGESTSTASAITTVLKSMAGGAAGAIPMGLAIPLGLELSENGTKKSVLEALKMASQNRNVRMLIGTGAAIGAASGLIRSALNLHAARQDRADFRSGLEDASQGGEGLSAALFGGLGGKRAPSEFSAKPVTQALAHAASPSILASARLGHLNGVSADIDPAYLSGVGLRVQQKMQQGYPLDPDRLDQMVGQMEQTQPVRSQMHDLVLNSQRELNIDPPVAAAVAQDIAASHDQNAANINQFNALAQVARRVRDIKRGAE